MDRFDNREAVRLASEEVPVLDVVRVRRQDGAVRTEIGLYTLNRITTTAARHVNWHRYALRRGRCDGTLAARRWKTSLAVLPRQRRWMPWFSPHIGDGRAALNVAAAIRPPSLRGMAVAIPGISLRWAIWQEEKNKEGSAQAARRAKGGSAIHDDGATGRQPATWTTGAVRKACAGSTWTRIERSRHTRLAQRLRQGVPIRECGNPPSRGLQEVGDGRSEEGRGATGYAYAATSRDSAGK